MARRMHRNNKANSLIERWEVDVRSYRNGTKTLVSIPQCETCINYIKGNALHCRYYDSERKPKYVLFPKKECPAYDNNSPIDLRIQNDRENKIYGGLFGFCVGDALGVPVEFSTREERKKDPIKEMRAYGTYHQPFGTWSDDTSLTICLIDAINRGYSIKRVAENFVDFYEKGYFTPYGEVFDIGISYVKRSSTELKTLRDEFNTTARKAFLEHLGKNAEYLRNAGFSETDILKIQNGRVPDGWQVHHKLPLDDSGTNSFDNLVLIQNEPYHKVITNYQNSIARQMEIGEAQVVQWPMSDGNIYPAQH